MRATHTQSAMRVVFLAPGWTGYYLQPRDYSATLKASDLTREHDPLKRREEERMSGGLRQRGSQADARAIKATGECDECGQSVKPPLKSQYYLQDILWCLQGLDKDKMGGGRLGGSEF